ncbi:MAG TPA: undecaprenyldiphospho-muramoylpentapeptide beta-N-acetylglucosaminyltransferase [Chitinophagaceae bacterium]|nr:undecaprenyldiphospho-muramoylpentapeptide beta-N-acetylglucosaminyltransferase [Chitinophagaceae bacterium]
MRMIIAGGGTGGHIFPAIAIANAMKKLDPNAEILFVGAKGKMEMEKVPQAGYRIEGLDIAGFNRSSLIKNIWLPFKLVKSFLQVRKIMGEFRPDAVVGVGGYSSFPVLRYAQQKGIPTYIHESNSFAGRSNIMLGKKAAKVFVATDGMEKFFPAEKIVITGNPVRTVIAGSRIDREEAIRFFGLDPNRKTILSIGGSLGAKSINEAIDEGLDKIVSNDIQLIWQTGKPYVERGREAAKGRQRVWVSDFIKEMEYAFAAADVVISRAGAMAIAELCVVGKPAIFVPYPFAAEDHQTVNAKTLADKQAGIMIRDEEAKNRLVDEAVRLVRDESKRQALSKNIAALGVKDADLVIAKGILGLTN